MLDDFNCLELENLEHQLYSQVHHSTCPENNVRQLVSEPEMPRRKVSYKPVRYFPRKKNKPTSQSQDQQKSKIADSLDSNTSEQNKDQTSQTSGNLLHPYPINNILVFPQNSDTLINVISQNNRDFSYRKFLRNLSRQKEKKMYTWKNMQSSNHDVKPFIREIKLGNIRKPSNVNRHIIMLSDSEDDSVNMKEIKPILKKKRKAEQMLKDGRNKKLEKDDKITLSTDDDVILVETQTANDVIEIDDCNMEQMSNKAVIANHKLDESNELLSTSESSTSNDFLEHSQLNPNPKFNFSLHGSEFKDSEFLRPTAHVDISESGSISSISDISSSMKTTVFNLVEFPKEKENLFDENNLDKFKNSITPQKYPKQTVIEDNDNIDITNDVFRNNRLPTLSDVRSEENLKRVRGRSIIRELVNDRAYVLLSSAEKKMKTKKRKSKDCISNVIIETDLSENTSSELSKKKKKKKSRKKDVNLDEENDSCVEFTEDDLLTKSSDSNITKKKKKYMLEYDNAQENIDYNTEKPSSRIMIRTDLFSKTNVSAHREKNDQDSDAEIMEKSEIGSKSKKKQLILERVTNAPNFHRKVKKDKFVRAYIINDEINEFETMEKSDINKKKIVHERNDDLIELNDEINTSVQRKKKRKKVKSTSEGENDDANAELMNTSACSISKTKYKKKRLSENVATEVSHLTEEVVYDIELNINKTDEINCNVIISKQNQNLHLKSDRAKRQKSLSSSEISSEVLHVNHGNLLPSTNKIESRDKTCTKNMLIVNDNLGDIVKSKHKKNETSEKSSEPQTLGSASDRMKISSKSEDSQRHQQFSNSEFISENSQVIKQLQSSENQDEYVNNNYYENVPQVEKNYTIFKETETIGACSTMLRNKEPSKEIIDKFTSPHSTKSIFSEISSTYTYTEENNCSAERTEKNYSADKAHSVWSVCSTKFFSSSESLFTVSTHSKNLCNADTQQKILENNVTVSSISTIGGTNTSEATSIEPTSENLLIEVKPFNEIIDGNHGIMQSTEQSLHHTSELKSSTTLTEIVECNEILSFHTELKIEDSAENSLQDESSHLEKVVLHDEPIGMLHLHIEDESSEQVIEQVVVKIEPESSGKLDPKQNQDLNLNTSTDCNLPFVSSSIKSDSTLNISASQRKLPDAIKKIVSEKDNVSSMKKLCEFLEEVSDPNDVLKKVSMIKEAFLAKSDVESVHNSMQEFVNDDDVISVSSDSSSVMCLENDTSIIDVMDDITLINCELGNTSVTRETNNIVEVTNFEDKHILEQQKTIQVESSQEQKNKTNNINDNIIETKRVESEQISSTSKFYDGNNQMSLSQYDVEVIQQLMSDDQKLWKICEEDLPQKRYLPKGKRCIKCREIGHLGISCPNKANLPRCILCGVTGHLDFKCPNKICIQCGKKSSIMKSICEHCKHYRSLTCSLCKMKGHPRHKCPDLWRRYHLTIEHGPLVKPEGMKLKEKENLWCSGCANSGHLEHHCYFAQRNRNFQQLDPSIHLYIDIYGVEDNTGSTISENTPSRKQQIISERKVNTTNTSINEIQKEHGDSTKNDFVGSDLELDVTTPSRVSSHHSHRQLLGIETSQEVVLKSSVTASCNVGIDDSPSDFATPLNQKSEQNAEIAVVVPKKMKRSKNSEASSLDVHVDSDTNSRSTSKSVLVTGKKIIYSDLVIHNFFIKCETNNLQNYITEELALLQKTSFKIKQFYYKFHAYRKDSSKPMHQWKIPLSRKQWFNKILNMMLFGKEHLKAGGVHYRKLLAFVNTTVGILPQSMRESLYYSYEYIFSTTAHPHVNYAYLMKLMMKKLRKKSC